AAAYASCPGVVCVDGGVFDWQGSGRDWESTERMLTPPYVEGPARQVLARLREHSQLPWDAAEPVVRRSFLVGDDGIMRRRTPVAEHMKIVRQMWEDRLADVHAAIGCPVLLVPVRATNVDERTRPFIAAKES